MASDDEAENLAHFLEIELLSEMFDQENLDIVEEDNEREEETRCGKRLRDLSEQEEKLEQQESTKIRIDEGEIRDEELSRAARSSSSSSLSSLHVEAEVETPPKDDIMEGNDKNNNDRFSAESRQMPKRTETATFSHIPPELTFNILKFLSSEDLVSCSLVCKFLNFAAADDSLWRRLYRMRWGLLHHKKPRECAWKKLYIQRDGEDMAEFVRKCPSEFKEYYMQMQVAKRSQAPNLSQLKDDGIILDKTLADQVSKWKSSRGLADTAVVDHACSGESCTYHRIGNVCVCEKTGNTHVCDDTCKETVMDPTNEVLVCTISGHCFDIMVPPAAEEIDTEQQQVGASTDEPEPFTGCGRCEWAFLLGYNCEDESWKML